MIISEMAGFFTNASVSSHSWPNDWSKKSSGTNHSVPHCRVIVFANGEKKWRTSVAVASVAFSSFLSSAAKTPFLCLIRPSLPFQWGKGKKNERES